MLMFPVNHANKLIFGSLDPVLIIGEGYTWPAMEQETNYYGMHAFPL